jgi:hypothetical protein
MNKEARKQRIKQKQNETQSKTKENKQNKIKDTKRIQAIGNKKHDETLTMMSKEARKQRNLCNQTKHSIFQYFQDSIRPRCAVECGLLTGDGRLCTPSATVTRNGKASFASGKRMRTPAKHNQALNRLAHWHTT